MLFRGDVMLAERSKADVKPWDWENIVKPMMGRFADGMHGKYAGQEVIPEVVNLFLMLTQTDHYAAAVEWLYSNRTLEDLRIVEQRRRANV